METTEAALPGLHSDILGTIGALLGRRICGTLLARTRGYFSQERCTRIGGTLALRVLRKCVDQRKRPGIIFKRARRRRAKIRLALWASRSLWVDALTAMGTLAIRARSESES